MSNIVNPINNQMNNNMQNNQGMQQNNRINAYNILTVKKKLITLNSTNVKNQTSDFRKIHVKKGIHTFLDLFQIIELDKDEEYSYTNVVEIYKNMSIQLQSLTFDAVVKFANGLSFVTVGEQQADLLIEHTQKYSKNSNNIKIANYRNKELTPNKCLQLLFPDSSPYIVCLYLVDANKYSIMNCLNLTLYACFILVHLYRKCQTFFNDNINDSPAYKCFFIEEALELCTIQKIDWTNAFWHHICYLALIDPLFTSFNILTVLEMAVYINPDLFEELATGMFKVGVIEELFGRRRAVLEAQKSSKGFTREEKESYIKKVNEASLSYDRYITDNINSFKRVWESHVTTTVYKEESLEKKLLVNNRNDSIRLQNSYFKTFKGEYNTLTQSKIASKKKKEDEKKVSKGMIEEDDNVNNDNSYIDDTKDVKNDNPDEKGGFVKNAGNKALKNSGKHKISSLINNSSKQSNTNYSHKSRSAQIISYVTKNFDKDEDRLLIIQDIKDLELQANNYLDQLKELNYSEYIENKLVHMLDPTKFRNRFSTVIHENLETNSGYNSKMFVGSTEEAGPLDVINYDVIITNLSLLKNKDIIKDVLLNLGDTLKSKPENYSKVSKYLTDTLIINLQLSNEVTELYNSLMEGKIFNILDIRDNDSYITLLYLALICVKTLLAADIRNSTYYHANICLSYVIVNLIGNKAYSEPLYIILTNFLLFSVFPYTNFLKSYLNLYIAFLNTYDIKQLIDEQA